jgi:ribA/ribD-fused uncharacterized protein
MKEMTMRIMISSFTGEHAFLSNFYKCPISYDTLQFTSSEAAYQAAKSDVLGTRMNFTSLGPGDAKKLGQQVKLRADWEEIKDTIMMNIVLCKFRQNPELAQALINTGDATLVEGNTWHDNYWGICSCPKCGNRGKNKLGSVLMQVRTKLQDME